MGYVFYVLMWANLAVNVLVKELARCLLEVNYRLVLCHIWLFKRVAMYNPRLVGTIHNFPVPILSENWEDDMIHEWYDPKE